MKNLSTKEVNYIKDLLSWELLSAKKSFEYANQETDLVRKQIFIENAQMHQQNYLSLLGYADQMRQQFGGGMQ